MVLVNLQGSSHPYALLDHAEWHGFTVADLVFPLFLFTAGLSVALVQERAQQPVSLRRIVRRGIVLIAIGLAIGWVIQPTLDPAHIRVAGVLQRIGLVYMVGAALASRWRGAGTPAVAAAFLLAVHAVLLAIPLGGADSLTMAGGLNGWLDQHLLPGKTYRAGYDPEGILSTLSAIASMMLGVTLYRLAQRSAAPTRTIALGAVLLIATGLAATPWLPLNKNLWTPSFALLTAGIGAALWGGLRLLWPRIGAARLAVSLARIGTVALTLYVVHMLMIAVLVRHLPDGTTLWHASFALFHRAIALPEGVASVAYALLLGGLAIALTDALRRRGWVLRA